VVKAVVQVAVPSKMELSSTENKAATSGPAAAAVEVVRVMLGRCPMAAVVLQHPAGLCQAGVLLQRHLLVMKGLLAAERQQLLERWSLLT